MGLMTAETFNKYFTVVVLTMINLLNYMDRFTIAGEQVHDHTPGIWRRQLQNGGISLTLEQD